MPLCYYRPQRSYDKVMFSQASVILFTGGGGHAWQEGVRGRRGACMVGGMCMAGGRAWQGRRPLQRTVRILLECIFVQFEIAPVILDHSVL